MNSIIDAQTDYFNSRGDRYLKEVVIRTDFMDFKLRDESNLLTERTVIFQSRIGIPVTRTTKLYHYHDPANRLFYP